MKIKNPTLYLSESVSSEKKSCTFIYGLTIFITSKRFKNQHRLPWKIGSKCYV